MTHLTFKQYLESKAQLLGSIENTPTSVVEYEIRKYCTLTLGESEDEKVTIGLKPKHKIIVEWQYTDVTKPTPESIRIIGLTNVDEMQENATFWSGTKLTNWLGRHATKGKTNGYSL